MNTKIRARNAICTAIISLTTTSCGQNISESKTEPSARDACYYISDGSMTCNTSLQRLLGNPESAERRQVILVGYLAPRLGVAMLYPDEQSYFNDIAVNAVAFEGDTAPLDGMWYKTIRLMATFSRKKNPRHPWFGELSAIEFANPVEPLAKITPVEIYEITPVP